MSTVLYASPVFGPVRSRRLGVSLGINLLPGDGKLCSFDCVYCECGFNADRRAKAPLPSRGEVLARLEEKLREMAREGVMPDVLTFAGNGEPTLHPDFPLIVEGVLALRDRLCPEAKVSVLSNATQIHRPEVRAALMRTDNPIMKLDTADAAYIARVDRPRGAYSVERQIEGLAAMEGKAIVQTMFMKGSLGGVSVDNTGPAYVDAYVEAMRRARPRQIMIYTLDRETPAQGLEKAAPEELDAIARRLRDEGFSVSVSY